MSDTPKSFRELAREMREAAKVMKEFARVEALAVSGCAEDLERLADESLGRLSFQIRTSGDREGPACEAGECSGCEKRHELALEFDAIAQERDEVVDKLKHELEKALKRELEKANGQLDIILRECQGDDDAFLANDYGGTGWEKEATVRWHRNSNEAAEKLAEALREWHNPIDCRIGPNCSACKALAAYRERMGRIAAWKEKYQ